MYGEQFLGDLCGIDFDTLAEGVGIHFARFDTGKGVLPLSGHFYVGNLLVLYYMIYCQSFLRRDKVLLLPAHIVTGEKGFDDGGTGGRCTDTRLFHAGTKFGIFHGVSAILHSRKQAALGVQGLGLGLLFEQFHGGKRQVVTFVLFGKGCAFFLVRVLLFPEDGTPAGGLHHRAFDGEIGFGGREADGGNIFHAFVGKGFEHTPGNQFVNGSFVGR